MKPGINGDTASRGARAARTVAELALAGALCGFCLLGGAVVAARAQTGATGATGATPAPADETAKAAAADSAAKAAAAAIPVRPPATPAELAKGQELLNKAVKATFIGKPSDLHSFAWTDSGTFQLGPEKFPLRTENILLFPQCYWTNQLLPMGIVSMAFCEGYGWSKSPRGLRDLVEIELKSEERDRRMDLLRVLIDSSKLKARPLADTVLSAGPAAVVFVEDDLAFDWRLYMDKNTGRIVRSDYLEISPMDRTLLRHSFEYHDYQPVDNLVQWPSLRSKSVNGTPYFDLSLQKAQCNPKFETTIFDKPKE